MVYLTDTEKRLLFAALRREKEVCKKIDDSKVDDGTCTMLVPIIESLERKFKYDRLEKSIRNKAIDEFAERLRHDCLDSCFHETHMFHILKVAEELKEKNGDRK